MTAASAGIQILRNATAVGIERRDGRIVAVDLQPTETGPTTGETAETLADPIRMPCNAVVGATDIPGFQRSYR